MSNTPHDLAEEFPAQSVRIHDLKRADAHFSRLVEDYAVVNRQVHRAETRMDILTDSEETALRHKRRVLKDQIAKALATT